MKQLIGWLAVGVVAVLAAGVALVWQDEHPPSAQATAHGGVSPSTDAQRGLAKRVPPDSMDSAGFDTILAAPLLTGSTAIDLDVTPGDWVSVWVECAPAVAKLTVTVIEPGRGGAPLTSAVGPCNESAPAVIGLGARPTSTGKVRVSAVVQGQTSYRMFVGAQSTDPEDGA